MNEKQVQVKGSLNEETRCSFLWSLAKWVHRKNRLCYMFAEPSQPASPLVDELVADTVPREILQSYAEEEGRTWKHTLLAESDVLGVFTVDCFVGIALQAVYILPSGHSSDLWPAKAVQSKMKWWL